jgi:hypothetical protein
MSKPVQTSLKNWWLLSVLALCLSIQALLLMMKMINFIQPQLPLVWLGCWLVLFILGQIGIAVFYKHNSGNGRILESKLRPFLITEAILTFFLLSALVKMIFYDYKGEMANRAYSVLLVLAVLNKFFWPYIKKMALGAYGFIRTRISAKILNLLISVGGAMLMAGIVFVPNHERVLARIYVGEQFHHYDGFIMAAGWAAFNHHIMDWDQISQYGLGMPYVFAQLCHWMGAFSHDHVFLIIMSATMIYYTLMFVFALRWFKSAVLTLAVMLWGIRVQMFHPGDYPFVLTYPSATVIRYFFDIFVMAAIFRHLQQGNFRWLLFAGALSGFAVYYMDSTGVFLLCSFYAYLLCLLIMPYTRSMLYQKPGDIVALGGYVVLPLLVAFGLFWSVAGQHLFQALFWHNFFETVEYFLSGIGTYPMYENFKYHNFWAGSVGFIIPAVWVFSIIYIGAMCYFKKLSRRHIFVIVICVYGLGINHYYIARAILTSYYVTALPFVFVCGYWLKSLFWAWPRHMRQRAVIIALAVSAYALVTNHNFMAYPNIFNWSRNPMVDFLTAQPLPADLSTYFYHLNRNDTEDLKLPANSLGLTDEALYTENDFATDNDLIRYYRQDFDFSKDAALIQSLTAPQERVALISTFETKILIQAERPPFFYYYPLINSRGKHMRSMPISFLHTNSERFNAKAIDQLREARPEYVFLEKIFLYNPPKAYADKPENIIPIVAYVRGHYMPATVGEYLVVMKLKESHTQGLQK